ncbi:MAG: hypothetical protein ACR2FE_10665 [Aeromicrobium sp.]
MGVELTFAMSTDSSAAMRVQTMLLPYDDRWENRWIEEGDHTYLLIRVPEGGVEGFIDEVRACHPTVSHLTT